MSFFGNVDTNATEFEMGGGALAPIPEDTKVLAVCEEAKNASYQDSWYVNLKWRISKPDEYNNRVIFQKCRVYDTDSDKAKRHKAMLAAIATNAGGGLFKAMEERKEDEPSDASLTTITNRPMVLLLGVWETDDKSGNWVKAVSARAGTPKPEPIKAPPKAQPDVSLDEIPF